VPAGTAPLRVLLVEDSVLLAGRLEELVRRLPGVYVVGIVDSEDEAICRIAESRPDVLVLDLHLRRGSGFGVLRALVRLDSRPVVIVLTDCAEGQYRREVEALGAAAFLEKSRDFDRLPNLLLKFAADKPSQDPSQSKEAPTYRPLT